MPAGFAQDAGERGTEMQARRHDGHEKPGFEARLRRGAEFGRQRTIRLELRAEGNRARAARGEDGNPRGGIDREPSGPEGLEAYFQLQSIYEAAPQAQDTTA